MSYRSDRIQREILRGFEACEIPVCSEMTMSDVISYVFLNTNPAIGREIQEARMRKLRDAFPAHLEKCSRCRNVYEKSLKLYSTSDGQDLRFLGQNLN